MIFHSLDYVVFFVLVLALYWVAPAGWRNLLLVPASLFFYGYVRPWILLPFAATMLIDYNVALRIAKRPDHRQWLVAISVISNLGLLGFFKYANFFVESAGVLLATLGLPVSGPVLQIVLPAGISFYTFQSIGYVVDVARGHLPACRSFRDYVLFISFFPQLVAGPIQRAGAFLWQIQSRRTVSPAQASEALVLLTWGFFKKLVIADNVAITANKVFAMQDPSFAILWTGVFAFCIQIYADFSAYTDIARGSARLFGFELARNFNHPYIADSPADFWRRWHITLSTWIRDYLFIPLGGSRRGAARTAINLTITFFLTGLWHGASWNFVIWGLYYAALTIIYRMAAAVFPESWQTIPGSRAARILLMFVLTNIGWLIFREQDLQQLWRDLTLLPGATPAAEWKAAAYLSTLTLIFALPLAAHTFWDTVLRPRVERWRSWSRCAWAAETMVALGCFAGILLLRSETTQDFIYFQF